MQLIRAFFCFAVLLFGSSGLEQPYAAQTLIPAPYPENSGSTAQTGGAAGGAVPPALHQNLIPHPVPQTFGQDAQGDPRPVHITRHQRRLPLPYPRQYQREN